MGTHQTSHTQLLHEHYVIKHVFTLCIFSFNFNCGQYVVIILVWCNVTMTGINNLLNYWSSPESGVSTCLICLYHTPWQFLEHEQDGSQLTSEVLSEARWRFCQKNIWSPGGLHWVVSLKHYLLKLLLNERSLLWLLNFYFKRIKYIRLEQ